MTREAATSGNVPPSAVGGLRDHETFLEALAARGLDIGTGEHEALAILMLRLSEAGIAPRTPAALAGYVAPLLARSAKEAAIVEGVIAAQWPSFDEEPPPAPRPPRPPAGPRWRGLWQRFGNAVWVLLFLAGLGLLALMLLAPPEPGTPVLETGPVSDADPSIGDVAPMPDVERDALTLLARLLPFAYMLAPLLLAVALVLARRLRAHGLSRQHTMRDLDHDTLSFDQGDLRLFGGRSVADAIRVLARQRDIPSSRLDLDRTIDATIATGGLFSPRRRTLPRTPEYVILSEWRDSQDHIAWMADHFDAALRATGAPVHRFEFDDLGHMLSAVDECGGPARIVPFETMLPNAENNRLILFCEAAALLAHGQPHGWLRSFRSFERVILLTPTPEALRGEEEATLSEMGIDVYGADAAGLRAAARRERPDSPDDEPAATDPARWFERSRQRWLGHRPPPETEIDGALYALRASLGPHGYRLLVATAAYPEIRPDLTRQLIDRLFDSIHSAETLFAAVGRLVWLREGRMPQWLRRALLASIPRADVDRIFDTLTDILTRPLAKGGLALSVAREGRWTAREVVLRLLQERDAEAGHDAIFLERMRRSGVTDDPSSRQVQVAVNPIRQLLRLPDLPEFGILAGGVVLIVALWAAAPLIGADMDGRFAVGQLRTLVMGLLALCLGLIGVHYALAPLGDGGHAYRIRAAASALYGARAAALAAMACTFALLPDGGTGFQLLLLSVLATAVASALPSRLAAARERQLRQVFDRDDGAVSIPLVTLIVLGVGGLITMQPRSIDFTGMLAWSAALSFVGSILAWLLMPLRRRLALDALVILRLVLLFTAVVAVPALVTDAIDIPLDLFDYRVSVTFGAIGAMVAHLVTREGLATPEAGRVSIAVFLGAAGLSALTVPAVPQLASFADGVALTLVFHGISVLTGVTPAAPRAAEKRYWVAVAGVALASALFFLYARIVAIEEDQRSLLALLLLPPFFWPLLKWLARAEPAERNAAGFAWDREGSRWAYAFVPLVMLSTTQYSSGPYNVSLSILLVPLALWLGARFGARGYRAMAIGAVLLMVLPVGFQRFKIIPWYGVFGFLSLLTLSRFGGSAEYRIATLRAQWISERGTQFLCIALMVDYNYQNSFGNFDVGFGLQPYYMLILVLFMVGLSRHPARRVLWTLFAVWGVSWLGSNVLRGNMTFPRFAGFQVVPEMNTVRDLLAMLLFFVGGRILRRYIANGARLSMRNLLLLTGLALFATVGNGIGIQIHNQTYDNGLTVMVLGYGPPLAVGVLYTMLLCLRGWRGVLIGVAVYFLAILMWNYAGEAIMQAMQGPGWQFETKILDNGMFYGFERDGYVQLWPGTEPHRLWMNFLPYPGGLGDSSYSFGPGYRIDLVGWLVFPLGVWLHVTLSRRYRKDPSPEARAEMAAALGEGRFQRTTGLPVLGTSGYERPLVWVGTIILSISAAYAVASLSILADIFVFGGSLAGYD